jgi:hypothetical protein
MRTSNSKNLRRKQGLSPSGCVVVKPPPTFIRKSLTSLNQKVGSRKLQYNQLVIDKPFNETKYLCRSLASSLSTTIIVEREPRELMPAKGTVNALLSKRVEVIFQ